MANYIKNIEAFCNKFNLIFEQEGECGFGRKCVGIIHGENYVDYNPTDNQSHEYIEGFYDERLFDIVPKNAYHKHNCLAVLGRGKDAIRQLSEWVDKLNELGATVKRYKTGATGFQAVISGTYGMAVFVDK